MLVFMIHAGIYDPCWYIYDPYWYLRSMQLFTIHAGIFCNFFCNFFLQFNKLSIAGIQNEIYNKLLLYSNKNNCNNKLIINRR